MHGNRPPLRGGHILGPIAQSGTCSPCVRFDDVDHPKRNIREPDREAEELRRPHVLDLKYASWWRLSRERIPNP